MNRIITQLEGTLLSCHLQQLTIETSYPNVTVAIYPQGSSKIFESTYYPNEDGIVVVHDIRTIFENFLERHQLALADFEVDVWHGEDEYEVVSADFSVLMCRLLMPREAIDAIFLTAASSRRMAPDAFAPVAALLRNGEARSYDMFVDYLCEGVAHRNEYMVGFPSLSLKGEVIATAKTSLYEMVQDLNYYFQHDPNNIVVRSFTMQCGARSLTCYFDSSLAGRPTFYFINSFGVVDSITLPAVTTAKQAVEQSEAVLANAVTIYDRTVEKTFEVQSDALTDDEMRLCEELFASPCVRVSLKRNDLSRGFDFTALPQVLITESTCETSDGNEKPNSVKFTWRYADRLLRSHHAEENGPFSEPFNTIFS